LKKTILVRRRIVDQVGHVHKRVLEAVVGRQSPVLVHVKHALENVHKIGSVHLFANAVHFVQFHLNFDLEIIDMYKSTKIRITENVAFYLTDIIQTVEDKLSRFFGLDSGFRLVLFDSLQADE